MIVTLSYFEFIELVVSLNRQLLQRCMICCVFCLRFRCGYLLEKLSPRLLLLAPNSSNLLALTLTCVKLLQGLNVYFFELLNQPL